MPSNTEFSWQPPEIRQTWAWDESRIRQWQLEHLNHQFACILPENRFYKEKLQATQLELKSLEELQDLPFTTKSELVESAANEKNSLSAHHTFPQEAYSRLHRTSGTTGSPLMLLDTEEDWQRWSWTWQHVLEAAEIGTQDRVFLAFSFGPFIGFWSAHQACIDRGAMVIPGGGLSSLARLEFMKQSQANVMCCTPSYALHLADVATKEKFDLNELCIEKLIVAGEAGGSVPSLRSQLESLWGAQVIDHSGATEVGPWGFGWPDQPGLHIIETSFIAELLPIEAHELEASSHADDQNEPFRELVLTSLGRVGAPVIRYRTGDVVIAERGTERCGFLWLPRGVVGRTDDMVPVRGINVFPSSIDAVVRQLKDVVEYQVHVTSDKSLTELSLVVECTEETRAELEKRLNIQLGLRIPVSIAAPNSLPRTELKARRWIRH